MSIALTIVLLRMTSPRSSRVEERWMDGPANAHGITLSIRMPAIGRPEQEANDREMGRVDMVSPVNVLQRYYIHTFEDFQRRYNSY